MTAKEYAETFSDMFYCTECNRCKADGPLCHNSNRSKVNLEPWKNYPNIYRRLHCIYKYKEGWGECGKCFFYDAKQHIPMCNKAETMRTIDQEIEQFIRNTTGEVEVYG